MAEDKNKQLFLSLIYSFQMQTMMQLGKLANPMTGTIEKELDGAQVTIDMLDMLKAKSKGNTTDDETRFLEQVIADLKLNYVEERDREKTQPAQAEGKSIPSTEESAAMDKSESPEINVKAEQAPGPSDDKKKPKTEKEIDSEDPVPPQE